VTQSKIRELPENIFKISEIPRGDQRAEEKLSISVLWLRRKEKFGRIVINRTEKARRQILGKT
jgi:hypothetical protein